MNKHLIFIVLLFVFTTTFLRAQNSEKTKAYVVSNAHFDSQWNWDVQRSISEFIPKTINQNLMLLEKYPNYIFNFEGGIKYSWMKEYFPFQYELVKKRISEGRWHVTGSTWDATDPNIPSPESFTRNILYGQNFYRDEFGVQGTDIFLPDCFGFGWTLPSISAHCGLIGFSTQKLMWRQKPFYGDNKIPFEIGLWQGVDGARIMLVADAFNYNTKWRDEDLSDSKYLFNITQANPLKTVYHYYGTGDTGGAPTIESVRAVEKSVNGKGPVKIISATSDQLYKDYLPYNKHPELLVYNNELLMDVHATGCYTSQAAMKLFNRRNELLADAAERAAVMSDWLGALPYPKQTLSEAWKRVIWHQFHDDLTGTSIPRAYEFSWNDELISMKQFEDVLTSSVGAFSRELDTRVKGIPYVIYNPLSVPVSDIVEVLVPELKSGDYSVFDETGKLVPCQKIATSNGETKLLIHAKLPSCGYVIYDVLKVNSINKKSQPVVKVGQHEIENSFYKVTLDKNGDIESIFDKKQLRELVAKGKSIRLALFTENESFQWPAWEILKKEIDKSPVSISGDVKISKIESGLLRGTLCVERSYGESRFKQYIRLNEGDLADRIDIVNEVDWQTTNALLKAEFPLNVYNAEATYDLGLGTVKRKTNTDTAYEVYAQYWADLTEKDNSYGVSVLNDCKYGWDKPDENTIRLTLLHTPKTQGGYMYQSQQDFGKHYFTYSIVGHKGDYNQGLIVSKAELLNHGLKAFTSIKHKGMLGKSFSFLSNDNNNVIVKAIKKTEKSDEYVIRLYETTGKNVQPVTLTFPTKIVGAKEINGIEDEIGSVISSGNSIKFEMKPYGIKSFKIKLAGSSINVETPASEMIDLPCNIKAATYNAYRNIVNFDGKGNSYAAEIFPDTVIYKGVKFDLKQADVSNAIKCNGQSITLPKGNFNKIYLLVASTNKDVRTTFSVDNQKKEIIVPSYSGFIGQWGHTGHTTGFLKSGNIAYVGTHRHNMLYNKDLPYDFSYMFVVEMDVHHQAKQIVLPNNTDVVVFAATMIQDLNNVVRPAQDLLKVNLTPTIEDGLSFNTNSFLTGKAVLSKSDEINNEEKAEFAIDEDQNTKWCDISLANPKFMEVDLGKEEDIHGWSVFHAGLEDLDYITKEYSLQVKANEKEDWKTIDAVFDNTNLETDRLLKVPTKARYVRLNVTKPDQSEVGVLRIYDFKVY